MKNSNGYGSIHKMNDTKRRKPWIARITTSLEIGEDGKAKQKRKILGTFATKKEALECLAQYHANKELYLNPASNFTFQDIYNQMMDNKKDVKQSTRNAYNMAFNILEELKDRNFDSLKLLDFQTSINNSGRSFESLRKVRSMISLMYDYAIKNQLINGTQNLAEWLDIGKNEDKKEKEIFTNEEIEKLFNTDDKDISKIMLILIYSGLRIGELLELKRNDIDLDSRIIKIVKSKTDNGIRSVPISKKIYSYIEYFYNKGNEYLLTNHKNKPWKYSNFYREFFLRNLEELELNMNLTPHSCRHTTTTKLILAEVPSFFIKCIIGHSSNVLHEKTYTHIKTEDLIKYIDMI